MIVDVGCRSHKRHRCTAVTDRPSSTQGQPRDLYRSGPPAIAGRGDGPRRSPSPSGASPGRLNRLRTLGRRVRTVHQVHWVLPWPTDPAPHVGATGHDGPQVHWEGDGSCRSAKAIGVPPTLAVVVIKATVAPLSQIAPPRREGSLAICIGPAPRYRRSGGRSTTVPKSNGSFPRPPEPAPHIGATGQARSPSPLGVHWVPAGPAGPQLHGVLPRPRWAEDLVGGRRAERGSHAWPVVYEHQGVRVCVHACVYTGGKWPRLHLRYPLSFQVQAPSPLLEGGVSPATTMQPESDDEPQGSRAESSGLTCAMCGDVFDYCEVGTFPSGG